MKKMLHIRENPNDDRPFWVIGEGVTFHVRCPSIESAWMAAKEATKWYPDASIKDHTKRLNAVKVP